MILRNAKLPVVGTKEEGHNEGPATPNDLEAALALLVDQYQGFAKQAADNSLGAAPSSARLADHITQINPRRRYPVFALRCRAP